jgi:hypothetical protein
VVICRLIYDAIHKGTINPILKFHQQRNENDKARRIKAAFTSPRLSKVTQCVASVIANEPPAQMPVLCGLVNKAMSKTTSAMECRIQLLKDQLKAVAGKNQTGQKMPRAMGESTKEHPEEEGHSRRPKEISPQEIHPRSRSCQQ